MRTPKNLILVSLLFTFLLSCGSPTQYSDSGVGGTGNIALGDESGIGGTGKQLSNAGVGGTGQQLSGLGGTGKKLDGLGGTGQIANTSGMGGTGIIGEVTGFGSIYVNGIEIEIVNNSEIRSDNKVNKSITPGIGDIVEVLAHRVGDETHARKINIRHEVVGPVDSVNVKQRRFTIIGQNIQLDNPQLQLPKSGDMIAVSGLRDQRGIIHATRVSLSKSKSVWLIDRIANNKSNTLKLGRSLIKTEHANYYRIGDIIRVRANLKNGQLFAEEIFSNQAFGNQVQHMILQGFIQEGNRNNYQIGHVQFSTRSARLRAELKQKQGRWTRIEIRQNQVGLWEVEQFIDNTSLIRGSLTSQQSRFKNRQLGIQHSGSESTIHDRFDSDSFPERNPRASNKGGNNRHGGAKQSTSKMPKPMNGGMGASSGNSKPPMNRSGRSGGMMF